MPEIRPFVGLIGFTVGFFILPKIKWHLWLGLYSVSNSFIAYAVKLRRP